MSIAENVARIMLDIEKAAIAAGRDPKEITLCAATKMNDADRVRQAIAAGIHCCGENRVQELTQKLSENAYEGADLHFIGHLQTNKVKQVVGKVSLIQSVDSLRLLQAVSKEAVRQGILQDILLEINIGEEASKSGFMLCDIMPLLENLNSYPNVRVRGLMAIPPICENQGDNDKFFEEIHNLSVDIKAKKYDNVCMEILSMGMSDDYEDAIAHGSTMIRIGTAIFGARNYAQAHQEDTNQ
jgi:pyridoxal phosphate enzyme (YggS family)